MFTALHVLLAFAAGAVFGVGCFALAIRVGRPPEVLEEPPTIIPEVPKHRPISGSDLGPGSVRPSPAPPAVPHRPVAGG